MNVEYEIQTDHTGPITPVALADLMGTFCQLPPPGWHHALLDLGLGLWMMLLHLKLPLGLLHLGLLGLRLLRLVHLVLMVLSSPWLGGPLLAVPPRWPWLWQCVGHSILGGLLVCGLLGSVLWRSLLGKFPRAWLPWHFSLAHPPWRSSWAPSRHGVLGHGLIGRVCRSQLANHSPGLE